VDGKFVSDFLVTSVVLLAVFVALIPVFVANHSRPQSYRRRVARKYDFSQLERVTTEFHSPATVSGTTFVL
jgi:hypothetical protein